jgi:hypothetical protein
LRATNARTRSRGRGERAALEVLNAAIAENPDLEAILFHSSASAAAKVISGEASVTIKPSR